MIYVQTRLQCSAVLYLTGKPVLYSQSSSLVYLSLELLHHYCTVLPGETTFFDVLTCEKPNERYPNYLQAWWLAPCSRPADPTLFAYIPAAGGIRTSSSSCAPALQDTKRCPGSRHTLYFTALGHLILMITTR